MEVTVKSADVDNLVRAIRTHADSKAIRKDLFRGLNHVGKDAAKKMVDVIDEALPSRGGLAQQLQDTVKSRVSAKSGKYAGVSLWFNSKGHDVRTLTGRRLRHPVFGNREVWVDQTAGVDPTVFPAAFERQRPDMTRAVNRVLEDIARKVTNI